MMEMVLQSIDYRGFRLTEIRREFQTNSTDPVQIRWRITRIESGVENIIPEAMSLDAAKAKVDARLAK